MKNHISNLIFVVAFFIFALLLNSAAMVRSTDNLPFDSQVRTKALPILKPIAQLSQKLHLTNLRTSAEKFERKNLEKDYIE